MSNISDAADIIIDNSVSNPGYSQLVERLGDLDNLDSSGGRKTNDLLFMNRQGDELTLNAVLNAQMLPREFSSVALMESSPTRFTKRSATFPLLSSNTHVQVIVLNWNGDQYADIAIFENQAVPTLNIYDGLRS